MKYLKVQVARKAWTDLYVSVPDSFQKDDLRKWMYRDKVAKIAAETTDGSDWDSFGWEEDLEINGIQEVDEVEARSFSVGEID